MLNLYKKISVEKLGDIYPSIPCIPLEHDKNQTHYYHDTNLFTPMCSPNIANLNQPFLIVVDPETSFSINPVNELIFQRTGDAHYRLIVYPNGTYGLLSAMGRLNIPVGNVIIPDGKYHFVICYIEEYKGLELKIGLKPHFYLNNKQHDHLVLAGEIIFKRIDDNTAIYTNLIILKSHESRLIPLKLHRTVILCNLLLN